MSSSSEASTHTWCGSKTPQLSCYQPVPGLTIQDIDGRNHLSGQNSDLRHIMVLLEIGLEQALQEKANNPIQWIEEHDDDVDNVVFFASFKKVILTGPNTTPNLWLKA